MSNLLGDFFLGVTTTVVVELGLYMFLRKRFLCFPKCAPGKILSVLILVFLNIFTNSCGHILYGWVHIPWLIVEGGILLFEMLCFWQIFKFPLKNSLLLSFILNTSTAFLAWLLSFFV